jgi:hypothetical protein
MRAILYTKNDHFTKTGSGQIQGKTQKKDAFLQGPSQDVTCNHFGRGTCAASTRRGAYECVRAYWQCRVSLLARGRQHTGAMSSLLGHYLMHHMAGETRPPSSSFFPLNYFLL